MVFYERWIFLRVVSHWMALTLFVLGVYVATRAVVVALMESRFGSCFGRTEAPSKHQSIICSRSSQYTEVPTLFDFF